MPADFAECLVLAVLWKASGRRTTSESAPPFEKVIIALPEAALGGVEPSCAADVILAGSDPEVSVPIGIVIFGGAILELLADSCGVDETAIYFDCAAGEATISPIEAATYLPGVAEASAGVFLRVTAGHDGSVAYRIDDGGVEVESDYLTAVEFAAAHEEAVGAEGGRRGGATRRTAAARSGGLDQASLLAVVSEAMKAQLAPLASRLEVLEQHSGGATAPLPFAGATTPLPQPRPVLEPPPPLAVARAGALAPFAGPALTAGGVLRGSRAPLPGPHGMAAGPGGRGSVMGATSKAGARSPFAAAMLEAQGAIAAAGLAGDAVAAEALFEPPGVEGGTHPGRPRAVDADLRALVEKGGQDADQALRLATLEVLERIGSQKGRAKSDEATTLEDVLYGVASGRPGSSNDVDEQDVMANRLGGQKGAAALHGFALHISKHPAQWSESFDVSIWRALGSEVTFAPWSLQAYGDSRITWTSQQDDLRRMFAMMATLHSLDRAGKHELVGAKIAQFAKAIELAQRSKGVWTAAWPLTGLPEPNPKQSGLENTLAHPAEYAAVSAYLREQKALEDALQKSGRNRGGNGDDDNEKPWWERRREKNKNRAPAAAVGAAANG